MADPAIIAGPACVTLNPNLKGAHDYYTDPSGVELIYERDLFIPQTANWGAMGARHTGTICKIRFTPVGHVTAALLSRFWPYSQADIGKLCKTTLGTEVVINPQPTQSMQKYTFAKGCITKLPSMKISANSLSFSGQMEVTCWGNPTSDQADANHMLTLAAATTAGATVISEMNFPSPRVLVTIGDVENMEVDEDGVMIDFNLDVGANLKSNARGPLDLMLKSLNIVASFAPLTLTEAEYHSLIALDNSGAKLPGDYVGDDATDLVITCAGTSANIATLTLKNMGPGPGGMGFSVDRWRQGKIAFHNKPLFSAGVPQPMYTAA